MTDAQDPLEFDILAELIGYSRQSEAVTVFADEKAAYELQQVIKEVESKPEGSEIPAALTKRLEAAKQAVKKSQLAFEVVALTRDETQDIKDEAIRKFPLKRTAIGYVEPNDQREHYYSNQLWSAQIVSITRADGAKQSDITPEIAQGIRGRLPDKSVEAVQAKIDQLSEDAAKGLDFIMTDVDFLS